MLTGVSASYSRRSVLGIGAGLLAAGFGRAGAAISGGVSRPVAGGAPAMRLPRFPDLATVADENGFLLPPGFTSA